MYLISDANGSGKTTLMNIITQVIPPTGGEILFRGTPIHKRSGPEICRMGIARTFQNPTVFETMSVYDNLLVGSMFGRGDGKKISRSEAEELLDFVGYRKSIDAVAGTLLVNDRKKIMIAIALSTNPELLILDEPCAGLNALEAKEAIALIHKITDQGMTAMLIEHNMKVLMGISDRVMIIDHGQMLCMGTPAEVSSNEAVIEKYLGNSVKKEGE